MRSVFLPTGLKRRKEDIKGADSRLDLKVDMSPLPPGRERPLVARLAQFVTAPQALLTPRPIHQSINDRRIMLLHHLAPERAHNLARPLEERAREVYEGAFTLGGWVRGVSGVGKGGVDGGLVEREGEDEVRGQVEREDVEVREREGKDGLGRVRVGVEVELGDL